MHGVLLQDSERRRPGSRETAQPASEDLGAENYSRGRKQDNRLERRADCDYARPVRVPDPPRHLHHFGFRTTLGREKKR